LPKINSIISLNNLDEISNVLKRLKIKHVIVNDTLLGLLKDKVMVDWDWDWCVDILLKDFDYKNDFLKLIIELDNLNLGKLKIKKSLYLNVIEILFDQYKCKIIILKTRENYPSYINYHLANYDKRFNNFRDHVFNGFTLPIPDNPKVYLEEIYSTNFSRLIAMNDEEIFLIKKKLIKNNKLKSKFNLLSNLENQILYIYKYIKRNLLNILSSFPSIEYQLGLGRERLFIFQLLQQVESVNNSKLIEIGSSDLTEATILSRNFKNILCDVYEASESTFKKLKIIKKNRKLSKIRIFNTSIIPSYGNYILKLDKQPNLNKLVLNDTDTLINKDEFLKVNTLPFDQIISLADNSIRRIVKMDIEGLEEDIFIKNSIFISQLDNISFTFELHQSLYKNKDIFIKVIKKLIDDGFILKYVELALFCDEKLLKTFCKNIIYQHNGRYLIENPDIKIVPEIVNTNYKLISKFPYYASRNLRSITLVKEKNNSKRFISELN